MLASWFIDGELDQYMILATTIAITVFLDPNSVPVVGEDGAVASCSKLGERYFVTPGEGPLPFVWRWDGRLW